MCNRLSFRDGTGIENFQDRETVSEKIKNERDTMEDRLLVNKYRKSYEDTIIELDDLVSVAILSKSLKTKKLPSNPIPLRRETKYSK